MSSEEKVKMRQALDFSQLEDISDAYSHCGLFELVTDSKYDSDRKILRGLFVNHFLSQNDLDSQEHVPKEFLIAILEGKLSWDQAELISSIVHGIPYGVDLDLGNSLWDYDQVNLDELTEAKRKLFTNKILSEEYLSKLDPNIFKDIEDKATSIWDTVRQVYSKAFLPHLLLRVPKKDLTDKKIKELWANSCQLFLSLFIENKSIVDIASLSDRFHEQAYGPQDIIARILNTGQVTQAKDNDTNQWTALLSTPWHDTETGLWLVPLQSASDLKNESENLSHCVGRDMRYELNCVAGRNSILSIRNSDNEPVSTIQFQIGDDSRSSDHNRKIKFQVKIGDIKQEIVLVQHRGEMDRNPPALCRQALNNFKRALENGQVRELDKKIFSPRVIHKTPEERSSYEYLVEDFMGFDPITNPEIADELWRYFSADTVDYEQNEDRTYKLDANGKRIPIMQPKYKKENGVFVKDSEGNKIPETFTDESGAIQPVMVPKQKYPELAPYKDPSKTDYEDPETGEWIHQPTNKNIRMIGSKKSGVSAQEFWGPILDQVIKSID